MPVFTVRELAGMVGGEVIGDGELPIDGISDLAGARPGQLSFLGNARYAQAARKTAASAILVAQGEAEAFPAVLIRVESPSFAFAKIAELFAPQPIVHPVGIHPTAIVAPGVALGQGVSVGPHVVLERGVRIGAHVVIGAGSYIGHESTVGEGTLIHPRVVLRERTVVGSRVILHSGVVLGSDGFGYEFKEGRHVKIPQIGYVQVDDDVEIGANTTVDRGRFGRTWIRQGAKIDNLVMIAHNVVVGEHAIIVSQSGVSGSTVLGRYVTLAGQVGLAGHLEIGDQATITAQSGVAKDVPAKAVVSGPHAMPLRERLRIEALYRRLPELWDKVRRLEKGGAKDEAGDEADEAKS